MVEIIGILAGDMLLVIILVHGYYSYILVTTRSCDGTTSSSRSINTWVSDGSVGMVAVIVEPIFSKCPA